MLSAVRYAGKVYQNELARHVLAAGYEIELTKDGKGVVEGFEIAGITAEERARASKRRAQIEKEIAAFVQRYGREPTTREVHAMTTATRDAKLAEITTAEVRQRQRAEFSPERARELDELVARARRRGAVAGGAAREFHDLKQACKHLFERASVRHGHEILADALNQNLGRVPLDRLKVAFGNGAAVDCVALKPNAESLHAPYATREGLRQELDAIQFVNDSRGQNRALGSPTFEADERLLPEQRSVTRSLLASTDIVCALRGVAGSGKTTALQEIRRGLTEANRDVIACAPTTSATQELRAAGFAHATTLADFLQRTSTMPFGVLRPGTTLIVDEAGIASTRQGAELFDRLKDHKLRLILVGDSRQHSGVEAGDFLSVLERHSRLRTFELTNIRRQKTQAYRAAVRLMAQGQAHDGLRAIDRLGWLHEAKGEYVKRAAEHCVENIAQKRQTILVAPTWEEINRATDAVRAGLKQRGLLGSGEVVTVAEPLSWTKAQTARVASYQAGQLLMLHRSVHGTGLICGSTVEVVAVRRRELQVRDAQGVEHAVSPARHATAWTVASPRQIEVAPGDRVLIRQNHRATGLVNGDVLTLESRAPSGAWVARDSNGREKTIPADFRAFTHGYAVTSHKAQGRTADEVIVCAARLDSKSAYVAFSRAREKAAGYFPDKAALFDALPNAHQPRVAAVDVWTPERSRWLRWARRLTERVRQTLAPRVPREELTVQLTPFQLWAQMLLAPVAKVTAPRPHGNESKSPRHHAPAPRQGMRMSM